MQEKQELAPLFEPIKIGNTIIKNRLVFPSMCTGYSDEQGSNTPRIRTFYEARAAGGVGMCIIPGTIYGTPSRDRPSIDDKNIEGWSELRKLISDYGAKLFCQLHPDPDIYNKPEEYTLDQIHGLCRNYATAARNAKKAGLDGIEIHGRAREIAMFLSPFFNRRKDNYGGNLEGRSRFALEVLRAVKESAGPDLPVIFRLDIEERITGGRDLAESLVLVKLLEDAGADALHISSGNLSPLPWLNTPPEVPQGHEIPLAARVKKVVSIPVITVGHFNDLCLAASAVQKGRADLIAIGRALLADPDLPVKSLEGRNAEIRRCIRCNQGCSETAAAGVSCLQNFRTGREYLPVAEKVALKARKTVLIAGSGPAGLEAACVLAGKGHDVRIYEQKNEAGGTFLLACKPPFKDGFFEVVRYRLNQLRSLGVEINYGMKVDSELVREIGPQVMIIATGSSPEKPPFPVNGREVYTADEVLLGKKPGGKKILLIGGGKVGCEVADYLANQNYQVDIAGRGESLNKIMIERRYSFLMKRLREKGVQFINGADILEVDLPGVRLLVNDREETHSDYDSVVLATGRESNNQLGTAITSHSLSLEVFTIGDALFPRTALEAISEAAQLSTI